MAPNARSALIALFVLTCLPAFAADKPPAFPVDRVTLYDCGLAQMERKAIVQGARKLTIPLQLAHLDDLLASLVLATDGGVKVQGVRFPSVRNAAQAAAGSGFGSAVTSVENETLTLPDSVDGFAKALVGTGVEVTRRSGDRISGTVLASVEGEPDGGPALKPPVGDGPAQLHRPKTLILASEGGVLTWIPLVDVVRIRPLSDREAEALESFAGHLGQSNGFRDVAVTIETSADSRGALVAGYIRQIPVWRMAYKTTVNDAGVTLEAWAVVHNDTREDWRDVDLTLLSGLPKSYILSLATPRYGEREALWLAEDKRMLPQLGGEAPDSLLYDWINPSASFGLSSSSYGVGAAGYGGGGGHSMSFAGATIGVGGRAEGESSLLRIGEAAAEETASGEVEKEIATYHALAPVTLPAGTSGMVPLIRRSLPGEAFTALNLEGGPTTCVRVENQTGLVLQEGVSSMYINGRFRGQTPIERTEPEEIRVWCFGQDPDVSYIERQEAQEIEKAVEWRNGGLWVHHLKTTTRTYTVDNRAGQPRTVAIGVPPLRNGRVLQPGNLREAEDGARLHLASVPARTEQVETVVVEEGRMRRVDLYLAALEALLEPVEIPEQEKAILRGVLPALKKAESIQVRINEIASERSRIDAQAQRQRANLQAVPEGAGDSSAVNRMLKDLMALEEDIREGEEKSRALVEEKGTVMKQVSEALAALSRDVP
ncbi:MAG: DUF4139 domain-containing protein [Pseudomonadota bacterium]